MNKTIALSGVLALWAGSAISQAPPRTASSVRCEGFPDLPAVPSALLELRLVDGGDPARLELRGGAPGAPASIAIAASPVAAPTIDQGCFDRGYFDWGGSFVLEVARSALPHGSFVCQGFGVACDLEGRLWPLASNGLRVEVAEAVVPAVPDAAPPTDPAGADFSLLRIELDPQHTGQVKDEVLAGDLVGALDTALNSHGDALQAKFGGKIMILVPGTPVQAGGSVSYTAKIARDNDEYLVSIGQDVAVLCGVKATANIGLEAGVSLGADQIYRFASPAEVARGLVGIALQQALPGSLEALRGENLARLRALRGSIAAAVAALDRVRSQRLLRVPALERALDAALRAVVAVHSACRRVGDRLERVAGWLCDEAQFVRDHTDGAEMRFSMSGEVSLKIGDKKLGDRVGAELGGKANGTYLVTVRLFQAYGAEPHRVEVLGAHAVGGTFAAGVKLGTLVENAERAYGRGFEIAQKTTRGLRTVFERRSGELRTAQVCVVIKREFALLSFGRETAIELDVAELGPAGAEALLAVIDGDYGAALGTLATIRAGVAVQDKLTLALKPEFGVENTGLTAKVAGECSWADCGPQRRTEMSLADVVERLSDPVRIVADVEQLVQDVLALPALQ